MSRVERDNNLEERSYFTQFKESVEEQPIPDRFNYPFLYEPHPLSILAAKELQDNLTVNSPSLILKSNGKMFGVLIVRDLSGNIGYLSAYSGNQTEGLDVSIFVPPIFDILSEDSFFLKGEQELIQLSSDIEKLKKGDELKELRDQLNSETEAFNSEVLNFKTLIKQAKAKREIRRSEIDKESDPLEIKASIDKLSRESKEEQTNFRRVKRGWRIRLEESKRRVESYLDYIEEQKSLRRDRSSALQQRVFDQYLLVNGAGEERSICDIFSTTPQQYPPGGSGDCAAPRLLQYAYINRLEPICMAEFWWGASPRSEVRKHGEFYPSCKGKCKPILEFMLQGIDVDPNPILADYNSDVDINTIYEDDKILVIDKPEGFLSVPGKDYLDSVQDRVLREYPSSTGPMIVHRLDMSTSGIMVIAKFKGVHKALQEQFQQRTVKKRYVALLEGIVAEDRGVIDLPLRVDLENRPHQLVCYEYGKSARTEWEVVERKDGRTRVHLYPVTGRTHQLRVHMAHQKGLNMPIVGDELYGVTGGRLHLHAEWIEFTHPVTYRRVEFYSAPDF